jgi:hypothetical protein
MGEAAGSEGGLIEEKISIYPTGAGRFSWFENCEKEAKETIG